MTTTEAASGTATGPAATGPVARPTTGPRDGLRLLCRDPRTADDLPWGEAHAVFDAAQDVAAIVSRQDLEDWLDCSLLHYPVLNAMRGGTPVPPEALTRVMHVSGDPRAWPTWTRRRSASSWPPGPPWSYRTCTSGTDPPSSCAVAWHSCSRPKPGPWRSGRGRGGRPACPPR